MVGAGAAGLATAIFTRRLAPSRLVLVVDGAKRPGAKILVSGGSRCNVTNAQVSERDFCGGSPAAVRRVLRALPVAETVAFFRGLGVDLREEAGGKLFPGTNRSRDVLDALLGALEAEGAELRTTHRVTGVRRADGGFVVETSRGDLAAGAVVLATGGCSLPKSGSDGTGLEIARRLGHTVVPTTPALVPLTLGGRLPRRLAGVAQDVELSLWVAGAVATRVAGALLWTHFGISGPAVLDVSRHWLRARLEGRPVRLTASFLPGRPFDAVDARWTALAAARPRATVQGALASMVPAAAAAAILDELETDAGLPLAHLSRDARRRMVHALVEWPLDVTGSRGYTHAEVTAGGVPLDEVDPGTMASRVCPGLRLVGEILDVDGRIGGFNFQWAWSSARAAASGLAAPTG